MREFFRPRRRKVGVCTLLMACLLVAGWVRSLGTWDYLLCDTNTGMLEICSTNQSLGMFYFEQPRSSSHSTLLRAGSSDKVLDMANHPFVEWNWKYCGFISGEYWDNGSPGIATFSLVPYWAITLPLTALAGCLLLKKPRKPTSEKIAEPTGNEGRGAA